MTTPVKAGNSPIRVLIADDHAVVRQGLAAIIAQEADMTVVAQADNGRSAIDLYREYRPDVALLDLRMPSLDAPEVIAVIRQEFRNARIIVVTTFDTDEDIYQCLRAGAMAYLLKGVPPEELLETIRAAHAGQKRIPLEMAAKLTERMSSPELTARELEVLRLLVRGRSNKEIASELSIEEGTVRAHCNNLFQKLEVNDRTQAAMAALRRGLIRLEDTPP
ncbi:MAG: two component LuxR family transcriptional regulator [Chthonomonadales bacterium]|nr:two component LuxR family transcriptional regulator [Chthonomonadales bacterium]